MEKTTDFVFDFLHSLSEKEKRKLFFLLKEDEKNSELNLSEALLKLTIYNEGQILKSTKYSLKSYQKIKSDLKTYLLSNLGYLDKTLRAKNYERLTLLATIFNRGFINEIVAESEKIEEECKENGQLILAYQTVAIYAGIMNVNPKARFEKFEKKIENGREYLKQELQYEEIRTYFSRLLDIAVHDNRLKEPYSNAAFNNLLNHQLSVTDPPFIDLHHKHILLRGRFLTHILRGNTKQSLAINIEAGNILFAKQKKEESTDFFFNYLEQAMCLLELKETSKAEIILKSALPLVEKYKDAFPSIHLSYLLCTLWLSIQIKQFEKAELIFQEMMALIKSKKTQMMEMICCQILSNMVLFSLHLSKKTRVSISQMASSLSFDKEWSKELRDRLHILEIFIVFDKSVSISDTRFKILDNNLYTIANVKYDVFKKANLKADYEFEIEITKIFNKFKIDTKREKIINEINNFIQKHYNPNCPLKRDVYVFSILFDLKSWLQNIIQIIEN
jgi:hypothetical protein